MAAVHNLPGLAPCSEPTLAQVAEQAAESIRTLNHMTFPGSGTLDDPADAGEVVASLARTASRMPQLLGQLSRWLVNEQRIGQLRLDTWSPAASVGSAVAAAVVDLTEAADAARRAGRALDAAHQVFAHLAVAVDAWDDELESSGNEIVPSARERNCRNACPE